jgi:ATP-dependent DNA helicase RecG
MQHIALETPLYEALGPKSVFLKRLEKLGVTTVRDMLWHFPVRYEDFSRIYKIDELEPGQETTVRGEIETIGTKQAWHRRMSITEAIIADDSGSIRAVWFNQPYIAHTLTTGATVNFAGKVSLSREGELYFSNPAYEIVRAGTATKHTARLVPIYAETRGLTSHGIRFILDSIMKRDPIFSEWIPESVLARYDLPEIHKAISNIHFPEKIEDALAAQKRFSFEEIFLLQLFNLEQRLKLSEETAPAIPIDVERIKTILGGLPFALTQSQKKSLWEIVQDMGNARPMNRLLQGDVGSGKTIVAAIAAMMAAEHGFQTAFMAPTEILARQHFETFKRFLANIAPEHQPVIGLATANETVVLYEHDIEAKLKKGDFWKKAAAGKIAILFGTHSLIQSNAAFANLGLTIIDEQHRFGVRQRAELMSSSKTKNGAVPHLLSMSATPIPRTLTLTILGDLDLSLITELPAGRRPIETVIVSPDERTAAYDAIRKEIKNGRQAFVICPLIEHKPDEPDADGQWPAKTQTRTWQDDAKTVTEELAKLSKNIFPDLSLAMLHGKMKAKEKDAVMRAFKEKKTDILVATSVVEVGIDVPNATIMMIENAERFGLAQLYQFRGRVGRGEHQSYCFLMTEASGATAKARLKAIVKAKNGYDLAEEDLKLRGPGEFLGRAQSGFPDAIARALADPLLVKESREAAQTALYADPKFKNSPELKERLDKFKKKIHLE